MRNYAENNSPEITKICSALFEKSKSKKTIKLKPSIFDQIRGIDTIPLSEIKDVAIKDDYEVLEEIEDSILENPKDPYNYLRKAEQLYNLEEYDYEIALNAINRGIELSSDNIS